MQTHKSQSLTKSKLLFIFGDSLNNLLDGGEEDEVELQKRRRGGAFAQPQSVHRLAALLWQISTPYANWGGTRWHSVICGLLRSCG